MIVPARVKKLPTVSRVTPENPIISGSIVCAENKLLMQWQTGNAEKYFHWILPVIQMKICCTQGNKKTAHLLAKSK